MSSLKIGGMAATGGLGILALGLIFSAQMDLGVENYFGAALLVFVVAGAAALLLKSM